MEVSKDLKGGLIVIIRLLSNILNSDGLSRYTNKFENLGMYRQ